MDVTWNNRKTISNVAALQSSKITHDDKTLQSEFGKLDSVNQSSIADGAQ
jgi:hypothetical protein